MNIVLFFSDNESLHSMSDDEAKEIMWPLVEWTFFPKCKCVLRMCDSFPLYNICSYQIDITSETPGIKFHTYLKFTSCSVHGLLGGGSLSCDVCQ